MSNEKSDFGRRVDALRRNKVRPMWAQITKVKRGKNNIAYAVTQDNKTVLVALNYDKVSDAREGDVISFLPEPYERSTGLPGNPTYFALLPKIIGYVPDDEPEAPAHAPEDVAEQIASGETK